MSSLTYYGCGLLQLYVRRYYRVVYLIFMPINIQDTPNRYRVKLHPSMTNQNAGIPDDLQYVIFKSPDEAKYPLPSPDLLRIHALCCELARCVGITPPFLCTEWSVLALIIWRISPLSFFFWFPFCNDFSHLRLAFPLFLLFFLLLNAYYYYSFRTITRLTPIITLTYVLQDLPLCM